jgi:ABC-type Fe3+/spermidine/putrescine transport system ATPase subunit/ABC-type sulfate transport system permease component
MTVHHTPVATRPSAAPLAWLALLLAAYLCAPLLAALPQIGLSDWHGVAWPRLGQAVLVSVASASVATVLIALGGIPLGYLLARSSNRALAVLGFVVQLPLALPPLASGVLLLFLFGPYSPVGAVVHGLTDSFAGIVLAQVFVAAPFLIVAARSAFGALDAGLEDVAATLGHGPWRCFVSISLPLAWATIRAGLLLSWLRAFGEFGATVMVAYHPYSLPVYTYVAFGSQGLPAMLPLLLPTLALAVAVALLAAWRRTPTSPQRIEDTPLSAANLLVPRPPMQSALQAQARAQHCAFEQAGAPASAAVLGPASVNPPAPSAAPHAQPALVPAPAPAALHLRIARRVGQFDLRIEWHAQARRLAILGASGSGKSLTLRMLAGLPDPPRSHADTHPARAARAHATPLCSLIIDNQSLSALPPAARQLAYVPQDYGLFPHMTVAEQLAFPLGAQAAAARDWLEHLGLDGLQGRRPAALSLGQRQRVALARALVRPCRLMLLDEPFAALDTPRRRQLQQTLRALQDELSAITILVTHDPDEAALLADEILVLDQGQVLQAGPTAELFRRPASLQVAALLGIGNLGAARKSGPASIRIEGGVELAVDPAVLHGIPDDSGPLLWRIEPAALHVFDEAALARFAAEPGRAAGLPVYAAQWRAPVLRAGLRLQALSLGSAVLYHSGAGDGGTPYEPVWLGIAPHAVEVWRGQA